MISLTIGNFLKIDSYSSHTPEVRHTSTEAHERRRDGRSSSREASTAGLDQLLLGYRIVIPSSKASVPRVTLLLVGFVSLFFFGF